MALLQSRQDDGPPRVDSDAGASGPSSGSIQLSTGGLIAVVVCVSAVVLFGIISSILFYLAKKRSWEIRKSIRRSAKRVVTALTPRRATFPKDVHQKRPAKSGMSKIDEELAAPSRSDDLEKGSSKLSSFELQQPPKGSKWAMKVGR